MMYINNWYVAGYSAELADRPRQVQMLGRNFVLFRDDQGNAACLSDVCPHRGAALSRGECAHGTVSCPFHGWQFDSTGQCRKILSQVDPDRDIPASAKVDAYAVEERYGLIWVFLGPDPDGAPSIIEMPEHEDAGWRRIDHYDVWNANLHWSKMTDLDHVHLAVVHGIKLGGGNPFRPGNHEIEHFDGGFRTTVINRPTPLKGKWGEQRQQPTEVRSDLDFHIAGFTLRGQVSIMGADQPWFNVFYEFSTPIDEASTHMYYLFFRNFFLAAEHDDDHRKRNLKNVYQDKANAESIQPKRAPAVRDWPAIKIDREDRLMAAYWKTLMSLRDHGQEIDRLAMDSLAANGEYCVIPSPARQANPHNWIFRPVPIVAPESEPAALHAIPGASKT
jgi:phenylpropionate dioxygenase-like ring-hydroxylating dioxygenase large terminal subunit